MELHYGLHIMVHIMLKSLSTEGITKFPCILSESQNILPRMCIQISKCQNTSVQAFTTHLILVFRNKCSFCSSVHLLSLHRDMLYACDGDAKKLQVMRTCYDINPLVKIYCRCLCNAFFNQIQYLRKYVCCVCLSKAFDCNFLGYKGIFAHCQAHNIIILVNVEFNKNSISI